MAKGFSVWALLKGKDAASGPLVKGLGKIRVAGLATGRVLRGALSFGGKLAGIGGAVTAAGAATGLWKLANSYATATDEQSKFARQNRIGIGALQEWNYAAGREGVTVEALRQSITGLTQNVGQMAAGRGRALKFLSALKGGKEIARDLTRATDSVAAMEVALQAIRRTSSVGGKAALAKALGFDESMVRLAAKSKEELAALRSEMRRYGTDTQASGLAAEDFKDSQERLQASFDGLHRVVGIRLMPKLTEYTDKLTVWIGDNKTNIAGWVDKAFDAGMRFAEKGIPRLIAAFDSAMPALTAFGTALLPLLKTFEYLDKAGGLVGSLAAPAMGLSAPGQDLARSNQDVGRRVRAMYSPADIGSLAASAGVTPGQENYWGSVLREANRQRFAYNARADQSLMGSPAFQAFQQQSVSGLIQVSVADDRVSAKATFDGPVSVTADVDRL